MMTNRERFMAVLNDEPVDRAPLFPLLMFLTVDRAGITYRQYATNGRALARAQLLVQERFDLDAITEQLQKDGVKAFTDSYDQLLVALEEKRRKF